MQPDFGSIANAVRQVFVVPAEFSATAASLIERSASLVEPQKTVALSFLDNLRGMLRTLSIPFELTFSQVHGLHWQRILTAERIRSLIDTSEEERDVVALAKARFKFQEFLSTDGRTVVRDEVLERLNRLASEEQSLATARELTRQGVVLMWSALEVLCRDLFVLLLNGNPQRVNRLLAYSSTRKRFSVEKIDWQTLSAHGFDLSSSMGTLLAQRADLDDIQTIREAFGALFPKEAGMNQRLADERLWFLYQKRNLIVHRRGIVDRHYLENTGHTIEVGSQIIITPAEIESSLSAVLGAGEAVIEQAVNDG